MTVGHFHIPGDATKREYAVYVMVARHRRRGTVKLYVGKTGDNRDGCNPVISRAGNHFSFNIIHSQMRNKLPGRPNEYDFDFFYTTFGKYMDPKESRRGIDVINEMERRLNLLIQQRLGGGCLLNRYVGKTVPVASRRARERLATPVRTRQLDTFIERIRVHLGRDTTAKRIGEEKV